MDHDEIVALYGRFDLLRPLDVAALLVDFDRPWWVVAGWAIEAFTGVERDHGDIDVGFFRSDLAALQAALPDHHVWSVGSGMLRPVTADFPDLHAESAQVWIRRDAYAPWLIDAQADEGDAAGWVNRRDPSMVLPLAEITWIGPDGLRYLNPELALLFKAKGALPKDDADLAAALPLLSTDQRSRFAHHLARIHPDHPWLARL